MRDIDGLRLGARQFGIEPRGIGNIGDQPVEALDIVLDDFDQPVALLVVLGEGSVSTALRSEVSGFLSSWETSAAKASIASMRL